MKQNMVSGSCWVRVWIPVGAGLFILALTVSAVVVPPLSLLHFFQALIYVAVIVLTHRNERWGFGVGLSMAAVCNSLNLFVTHLIHAVARSFWFPLRVDHLSPVPTM